jgi:hypothetical protein
MLALVYLPASRALARSAPHICSLGKIKIEERLLIPKN